MSQQQRKKVELRLLNKLTGEVNTYEIDPEDPDALAEAEEEAKAFIEEIDKFRANIKQMADRYLALNDYKPVDVLGGKYQWVHKAPVTLNFQFETVNRFIDTDRMLTFKSKKGTPLVKVQSGPLKELVADMIAKEEVGDDAWKEMVGTAESRAAKPYVMLERLK